MDEDLLARQDLLSKLTQGISEHIKTSTRYLLALLLVSVITLVTSIDDNKQDKIEINIDGLLYHATTLEPYYLTGKATKNEEKKDEIKVPFIENVNVKQFYPISATFICILIILFGIAYSQSIRSRKLLSEMSNSIKLNIKSKRGENIDIRDISEILISTSINTTAPLSQSMLGKFQFHHNSCEQYKTKSKILKKKLLYFYDFILKIAMIIVIYGLPISALIKAYTLGDLTNTKDSIIPLAFTWGLTITSSFVMLQLIISDLYFACASTITGMRLIKINARRCNKKTNKNPSDKTA